MIAPIFDQLLLRAATQLTAARESIAHGNIGSAAVNVQMAADSLDYFQLRLSTPATRETPASPSLPLTSVSTFPPHD